jgi:hypothetical protein
MADAGPRCFWADTYCEDHGVADNDKRYTLVEGTPNQHADAAAPAYKRARQGRFNRHWLFYALVLLGAVGYAVYNFVYPLLYPGP